MLNKLKNLFSNSSNSNSNSQSSNNYATQAPNHNSSIKSGNVKMLREADANKKVVAVIVSFVSGSSYDHLFTSVEQKAQEGTQVLVYACDSTSVRSISQGFDKQSSNQVIKKMVQFIKGLDADCVVFNWECCSGYSGNQFSEGRKDVLHFVKKMIDRGHMCMFSDFSLKALIADWDDKALGPNPFKKVAEYGGQFILEFEPQKLKECPSAQLQIIGQMAAEGHCKVQAMGGTIVYGVNTKRADTDQYKLQILTVVTSLHNDDSAKVNNKAGQPGHVLLTYKSGGHILTSMGHWIELMKVDTSQKVLFDIAVKEYGQEKAEKMRMEYDCLQNQGQRKQYINRNAVEFVQSSAPCGNMAKKARSKY